MLTYANNTQRWRLGAATLTLGLVGILITFLPLKAQAVPSFARQTGQNCVACHAGGQFPELTPYGRMFKLTGYTIGQRAMPLAVMGVAGVAKVANTTQTTATGTDPNVNFYKNNTPVFAVGSLFAAGKISDNVGAFTQITYDNYAVDNGDNTFSGHTQVDNIDLRYANHLVDGKKDWVYGISLNNNPSVSDPWNTAAAWMQYVPVASVTSHQFTDANTPFPGFASGGNVAGITAYGYWNKTLYAEAGLYRTADNAFRFMSGGIDQSGITRLNGTNPYWRLAYTREWGPNNLMVGATGMLAHVFDPASPDALGNPSDPSDSLAYNQYRNTGIDAQYQYILDPHTFTMQAAYMRSISDYSPYYIAANSPTSNTSNVFRAKASYIYQAKYGGSLAFFDQSGNFTDNPDTRGFTYEAFWMPKQNVRFGAQYTAYNIFNGAANNYDGLGRNASDNNTLYLYAWFAF